MTVENTLIILSQPLSIHGILSFLKDYLSSFEELQIFILHFM